MSQEKKMDIAKVLAILSQPKEELPPLEHVERLTLEIPYITRAGVMEKRGVRVVIPQGGAQPMPLIYVPHYEMGEDSVELRDYLAKDWAVACPDAFDNSYNGKLTDDDLVFNNAALYALRHRTEFDRDRIALVGGSAGGYMTMMLNGLQLGHCVSIANGPVTNAYFNFHYYFKKANGLNLQALAKLAGQKEQTGVESVASEESKETPDNAALALLQSLQSLPIPFLAGLVGMFEPIEENFPDKEDFHRWEELSAVGHADCFCSPILVSHCTSDVLVPVDQISRKFTYDAPGDSLPADFDMKLPAEFPGNLGNSLEECLPGEDTRTERIPVPEKAEDSVIPYDISKRFNINIYDDGPAEGYGTHSSRMDVGRRLDVPYLEEMLAKTAKETCVLTPAMLKSLLLRYQGECVALPAHTGVDDTVYGSLCMYQKEVREELEHYGKEAVRKLFESVRAAEKDSVYREKLQSAMDEIME